jgi:hypothetical protein
MQKKKYKFSIAFSEIRVGEGVIDPIIIRYKGKTYEVNKFICSEKLWYNSDIDYEWMQGRTNKFKVLDGIAYIGEYARYYKSLVEGSSEEEED